MIKIAVSGKLGSGKDLFLYYAQSRFPQLDFRNKKFAGPIYDCAEIMQWYLDRPIEKDGALLQFVGEHYRKSDPDFWVKKFFKSTALNNNHIVTDVRFPNELQASKDNGYVTVRIHRKDELRLENIGNRNHNHISETALDGYNSHFDYTINNNGSLEFFEGAVIRIIDEILRNKK